MEKVKRTAKHAPLQRTDNRDDAQKQGTYFTWLADELITVPDFPAWICDVCCKREYDVEALNRLALLLSPLPAKKTSPQPKKAPAKSDSPKASAQPPSPE